MDGTGYISLGSNVLSATGMSRPHLRHYVGLHGLFGRDSALSSSEQDAVRAALSPVARAQFVGETSDAGAAVPLDPRPEDLHRFAVACVRGKGSVEVSEWTRARTAGLSRGELAEVLAVVGVVKEAFGLSPVEEPKAKHFNSPSAAARSSRNRIRLRRVAGSFMRLFARAA